MIRVFPSNTPQNGFDKLATVIRPMSAYINEELNGEYSYELVMPILTNDDGWKMIQPWNIIKSTTGQLFQIKKVTYATVNSVPCVKAYATHIWYYLSDASVNYCGDKRLCYWAMADLFSSNTTYFPNGDNFTNYNFSWSVDVGDKILDYQYKHVSLAYAILGSPDSIINTWGGYLYRDNFSFSIKSVMQNSQQHAFALAAGDNCSEIKATIDWTDFYSNVKGVDQFGSAVENSWGEYVIAPHKVIYSAEYAMRDNVDDSFEALKEANGEFFNDHWKSKKSYEVTFVDEHNTHRNIGWERLRLLKVGDSGTITDYAGNTEDQTIISTRYNDLTKRIDSLKLGTFIHSDLHQTRWDKIISGDSASFRRLDVDEKKIKELDEKSNYFTLVQGG